MYEAEHWPHDTCVELGFTATVKELGEERAEHHKLWTALVIVDSITDVHNIDLVSVVAREICGGRPAADMEPLACPVRFIQNHTCAMHKSNLEATSECVCRDEWARRDCEWTNEAVKIEALPTTEC